tara:strand:+ start:3549 stop:3935 length:387 start_codon:yes stop_codon:yes gene_type:complete
MRIKHNFTTDFENLDETIKFYLKLNNKEDCLQKSFANLLALLSTQERVDYAGLHKEINLIRVNILKYDCCLAEISDICTTIIEHQSEEAPVPSDEGAPIDKASNELSSAMTLINNLRTAQKKDLDKGK